MTDPLEAIFGPTGLMSRALTSPCGKIRIPINESIDDKSQIEEYLRDYHGEGIQHVAFAVSGIQDNLTELEGKGVQLIDKAPRKGAEGLNIAFLHPKSTHGVLLELCEDPKK